MPPPLPVFFTIESTLCVIFFEQGENNRGEKKKIEKIEGPILLSDSGFEPLVCPAVSVTALHISLIQQWLICIKELLCKGKVFKKNTE